METINVNTCAKSILMQPGDGMLTGEEILRQVKENNIIIDPFDESLINPNSYNLRISNKLKVYSHGLDKADIDDAVLKGDDHRFFNNNHIVDEYGYSFHVKSIIPTKAKPIDMHSDNEYYEYTIPEDGMVLYPNILYIGSTIERCATDNFIPMINGRSSGGRLGLSIHICAGFGDIGFDGTWTLEITVVEPLKIYPGEEIAQVCYFTPAGAASKLYRGRYYKQEEPTVSRFFRGKINY